MRSVLGILAFAALLAAPALAIDTPHVAGDMNGWDAGANPMTETSPGSGIWECTFTTLDPLTRYEFKITDGTWDNLLPSSNSWLFTDAAGAITITYDANWYDDGWAPAVDRLGLNVPPPPGWTAVGSWQGWDPNNPATKMPPKTHPNGGVYEATGLDPNTYYWKAAVTGSWDAISWDERSINPADMEFIVNDATDVVSMWVDNGVGVVQVQVRCLGDLNGDKSVNLQDLAQLLGYYGCTSCEYGEGDLDLDGDVELSDLAALLSRYGTTCP